MKVYVVTDWEKDLLGVYASESAAEEAIRKVWKLFPSWDHIMINATDYYTPKVRAANARNQKFYVIRGVEVQ